MQIHDFDWFRTDHRAVYCVVSVRERMRYTEKPGRSLRGWKPVDGWKTAASEALTNWSDLDRACTETVGSGGGKQGTGDE